MARLPRLTIPGQPHHLIQRGNNRQATFLDAGDFEFMLTLLGEYAPRERVAIHGYVLMDNHFHLLATPETRVGLPAMMQSIGRRYVRRFNQRHQRSGALWEGRYRATALQPERYLLACMVYIDLNPVRAGMVQRAADYTWSSHRHYTGIRHDPLVSPHALYWQLGNTPFEREAAYARLTSEGVSDQQQLQLTESTLKGWALGETGFVTGIQEQTARRVSRAQTGRPRRKPG